MDKPSFTVAGIDPTAGRQPFTFAVIDQDKRLVSLDSGAIEQVVEYFSAHPVRIIAVNAPPRPNAGLVRQMLEAMNLPSGQLRGSDLRKAENELREHGITVSPTPGHLTSCPSWMQMGFDLYRRLEEIGYSQLPAQDGSLQWLETHPHAAFCALLGQIPLPKPSLEGRLQRQIALFERGMGIKDPMEFFEEITRHKLLHGSLPLEWVYAAEELDTLMAAYTAFCTISCPQEIMLVGDLHEGQIALPVGVLKDRYQ